MFDVATIIISVYQMQKQQFIGVVQNSYSENCAKILRKNEAVITFSRTFAESLQILYKILFRKV